MTSAQSYPFYRLMGRRCCARGSRIRPAPILGGEVRSASDVCCHPRRPECVPYRPLSAVDRGASTGVVWTNACTTAPSERDRDSKGEWLCLFVPPGAP